MLKTPECEPLDGLVDARDRLVGDSSTLARYWNDALPDAVNVDTIAWWLGQAADAAAFACDGDEVAATPVSNASPQQRP